MRYRKDPRQAFPDKRDLFACKGGHLIGQLDALLQDSSCDDRSELSRIH